MRALALILATLVALPLSAQDAGAAGAEEFDPDAFFAPAAHGDDGGVSLSGRATATAIGMLTEPWDPDVRAAGYSAVTAFQLDAEAGSPGVSDVDASVVLSMYHGQAATAALMAPGAAVYHSGSQGTAVGFELATLRLAVYAPWADFSVGRMPVNFGRGTVLSPVDIFSPVNTGDLALGRTGTDAFRMLVPLGTTGGLDAVASLAAEPGDSVAGARVYGNLAGLDAGLSLFRDGAAGQAVFGLDLKADLVLGLCAEAVARMRLDGWTPDPADAVYSVMAGADYSFGGAVVVDAEYQWHVVRGAAVPVGTFRAEHTAFLSLSWAVDDANALDVRGLWSPSNDAWQTTVAWSGSVDRGLGVVAYALWRSGDLEGMFQGLPAPPEALAERLAAGVMVSLDF